MRTSPSPMFLTMENEKAHRVNYSQGKITFYHDIYYTANGIPNRKTIEPQFHDENNPGFLGKILGFCQTSRT